MTVATQSGRPARQQRRPRRWPSRLIWGALVVVLVSAAALSADAALSGGQPGLDADAVALGHRPAGRAQLRAARRIAPVLPVTVIASEDGRFCSHRGVDWQEIRERLDDADDFGEARGGSTITQQTAKNLFLWQGRSFVRKALEFPLALWIDLVLPKRRILEIYLNIAEWGPNGEFGAEAGSRRAFNKSGGDHAREAALLAAMLPNPIRAAPGSRARRCAGSPASTRRARARPRSPPAQSAPVSAATGRARGCDRGASLGRAFLYKPGFPK